MERNRLERLFNEEPYPKCKATREDKEGLLISGANFVIEWISRPHNLDRGYKFKIFDEIIRAGEEYFEREGVHPEKIITTADRTIDQGGTGLVYSIIEGSSVKPERKNFEDNETYLCRVIQNPMGTSSVMSKRYIFGWDKQPSEEIRKKVTRRLMNCLRKYAREKGEPAEFGVASYFSASNCTAVNIDHDGKQQIF